MRNSHKRRIGYSSSRPLRANPETVISHVPFGVSVDGSVIVDGSSAYVSFNRSWGGSRTPGFGSLSKRQLPVNAHGVLITSQSNGGLVELQRDYSYTPDMVVTEHVGWGAYDPWSLGAEVIDHDANHLIDNRNTAISRLGQRSGQQINNVAQDVVQMSQMTRMVSNSAKRIAEAVHNTRKGNFAGAARSLWGGGTPRYRKKGGPKSGDSLANNWLEFQYGWKPLLQDVKGAAESLARFNLASDSVVNVVRSSASSTRVQAIDLFLDGISAGKAMAFTKTDIRFGARYVVSSPGLAFFQQTGFTNPLNLAWEVLPFSFVVDWFLPIGQYLESQSQWQGLSFIDGWETRFTKMKVVIGHNWERTTNGPSGILKYERRDGFYSGETVRLDRLQLNAFPAQTFPSFKNPFSTAHALNSLALLRQVFR